ncbi:MAG: hypothetical protein U0470_11125 [Anaerolineae bacterium]
MSCSTGRCGGGAGPPVRRRARVAGRDRRDPDRPPGRPQVLVPDAGWLLVRFSGTEPLMRIYVETTHADRVDALLDAGLAMAGLDRAGRPATA